MPMKILVITFLLIAEAPQGVSKEEYFRRQCDTGDQHACEKVAEIEEGLVYQQRLEKRSNEFWTEINTDELMLDRKTPDLQDVYPLVMRDFIAMEAENGSTEKLDEERLPQCAAHYHNHWVNRKMWWPRLEDGTPDWPGIYYYIVDHYYGYCLRKP
jgi:hypothetical protein